MTPHNHLKRAFTLIELLLVLVILAILASVVTVRYFRWPDEARERATLADMANLKTALSAFCLDNSRFPTTLEGLDALVTPPADLEETWKGPYIEQILPDKWGVPFIYRAPGIDDPTSFDLVSCGRDRTSNTDDDLNKLTVR